MTTPSKSLPLKRKSWKGKRWQNPNVAEASRVKIHRKLEEFLSSKDEVYTFEANLTNFERALVHQSCRKMGMRSKSSGSRSGNQRHVSVYKSKRSTNMEKENECRASFTFSEEGKAVLRNLFTQYPPDDCEVGEKIVEKLRGKSDAEPMNKEDFFWKPTMDATAVAKKLKSCALAMEKDLSLRQVTEQRCNLPIASFRDVITSTIESHQVVLISGETGCGKSTQVPQYLLDSMWKKGEACKIICTQPRRISATSVAERISFERGENVGDTVGYKIRLESKGGRHSSIVFCTNGVLLRVLVANRRDRLRRGASRRKAKDKLSNITHILVDEIHERDCFSDMVLAIIRDSLPFYPHLHLVLMSATLDAERFSQYFAGCPVICVPGFTYPVKTFFLEDVLSLLNSTTLNDAVIADSGLTEECRVSLNDAIGLAWSTNDMDSLQELVFSDGGSSGNCHLRDNDGKTALDWAALEKQAEAADILQNHMENTSVTSDDKQHLLDRYLSDMTAELVDFLLIEKLLRKICTNSKEGAILVFLSGWDDISRAREKLSTSAFFKDSSRFFILVLHSMVPSVEQKKVFKRPPQGCRKIILSTNIAETAVTIDDVVYVIDSGRIKERSYDPYNNVSTLQSSWISKASAKQREGRAGRCHPGTCYHLYSKLRASSLPDFQVPEIKRMPIEELCLQVKLLDPDCKIDDFLKKTLDPPVAETIKNSISVLQDIGALSPNEELTELGRRLGSLPVHPLTSKMLFVAILLNCLDPALTLACASDYRDPFTLPMLPEQKQKAYAAKLELASLYGGRGDQLAVVAAFECWKNAKQKGQEARFCSQYYVSSSIMHMLSGLRKQLQSELFRNGFIPEDSSQCSVNAQDPGIIHAVVVAGLYPKVGRLRWTVRNGKRFLVETPGGDKVRLHPHSMNSKLSFKKTDAQPLVTYEEIIRGDGGLHIRNCTLIGPLPLLLLAKEIAVAPGGEEDVEGDNDSDFEDSEENVGENMSQMPGKSDIQEEKLMSYPENTVKVLVDRWLFFESTALDVAQIYCLRERLSAAILFKITRPWEVLPELLGASLYAISCVISCHGLKGITSLLESLDSHTSVSRESETGDSQNGRREGLDRKSNSFLNSLLSGSHQSFPHHHPGTSQAAPNHQLHYRFSSTGLNPHPSFISDAVAMSGHEVSMFQSANRRGDSHK